MSNEQMKVVWAARCVVGRPPAWRKLYVAYTPDAEDFYQRIARDLCDGVCNGEEEYFDLAVGTMENEPSKDAEPFDYAQVEGGFGQVRINFEEHGCEYVFGG